MSEDPVEWLENLYDQAVESHPRAGSTEDSIDIGTWSSIQFWNRYRRENRITATYYTQIRERSDDQQNRMG